MGSSVHRSSCSRLLALSLSGVAVSACGDIRVPVFETVPSTLLDSSEHTDAVLRTDGAGQQDVATSAPLRYEAEAVPPNVLTEGTILDLTCFGTGLVCPVDGVKEGANCCSGGGVLQKLIGRAPCSGPPGSVGQYTDCEEIGAGVEFHDVTVPANGTYDVTWWYHCGGTDGDADVAGDTNCGGLHYSVGGGCRSQLIHVNGVAMSATVGGQTALFYQFPCYADQWSVLHAATTALPLTKGSNVIYLHAPHAVDLDATDIDAIDVLPQGQGALPLVTPVVSAD